MSEEEVKPEEEQEDEQGDFDERSLLLTIAVGAAVGAATALYLADKSTEEARKKLREEFEKVKEKGGRRRRELDSVLHEAIGRIKQEVEGARSIFSAAIEAGTRAAKEELDRRRAGQSACTEEPAPETSAETCAEACTPETA